MNIKYPSQEHLIADSKMAKSAEMSALKGTVKRLLEKQPEHDCVTGLNIIMQGGEAVSVTYAGKMKDEPHYKNHKAGLRQTEGRIELLEIVNT
jgi:hypothetical protein